MPFVATSVDQLRVGDIVKANTESGETVRGFIRRIDPRPDQPRRATVYFADPEANWYFDPSPLFGFKRTWTVLNRDLEPEPVSLADVRVGDRIALVRRREGVVAKVGDSHVRFEDGRCYSTAIYERWTGWFQTIEVIERAPEPLTAEQKLERIQALIDSANGILAATLVAKIADVLK